MSVRARNERYTIDYYPNGRKGRRIVRLLPKGTTAEDAAQIEKESRSRNKSIFIINPSSNISRLIPKYMIHCDIHQSAATARDKRSCYKVHIIPFFGNMHIEDITNAHIASFKQKMKRSLYRENAIVNSTITKSMNYFSAFLKWAEEELNVRPLVPIRFRRLPHTRPIPIVLSLEEAMSFINASTKICHNHTKCTGHPKCIYKVAYNVLFKIFFYLGLRNRAARYLRWEDIDWTKHAIKTIEKGNKFKWHPIPDDLYSELRHLHIGSKSRWIFPSPRNLNLPINNLKKAVERAKKKAGISKRIYPHLLRHSIATHLLDSDVDIRQIQGFLDHSHISTTEFYTRVSMEKKRQALEKAGFKTTKAV